MWRRSTKKGEKGNRQGGDKVPKKVKRGIDGSRFFALGTFAPPYFGTVAPPYFETSATPHFETVAPPYFGTFALHS